MKVQRFFVLSACAMTVVSIIGRSECSAAVITPISGTASSAFAPYTTGEKTRDGSGLSGIGPWQQDTSQTNTNQWLSDGGGVVGQTILWDLGSVYSLTGFHMWNANEGYNGGAPANLNRGIQVADISVSTTGLPLSYTSLGNKSFFIATGFDTYTGDDYALVTTAQFIKFTVVSTFGDLGYVGVSEMRFISTPEPNSIIMFGFGTIGLFRIVRRRK